MNFESEIIEVNEVSRTVKVQVSSQEIIKAVDKRLIEIQKKAKIKGFREGKAPLNLVKSQYEGIATEEVMKDCVNDSLNSIITEKLNNNIVGSPVLTSSNFDRETKFEFSADLSLFPNVNLGSYQGLDVEVEFNKVEEKDVLDTINKYAESLAKTEIVSDRTNVIEIDVVTVDFTRKDSTGNSQTSVDQSIDLSNKAIFTQVKNCLVGSKIGDNLSVLVDEDEKGEKLNPESQMDLEITVKGISKKVAPEINDQFVKDLNIPNIDNFESYKSYVKNNLEKESAIENDRKVFDVILDKVAESSPFMIPQLMIDYQIKDLMVNNRFVSAEQSKNLNVEPFRQMFSAQAEKILRHALIVDKIAELENMEVSEEEFHHAIHQDMEKYGIDHETIHKYFENPQARSMRELEIKRQKVLDFLKEKTKVTIK